MFSKGKKTKETKRNNPKESSGPFSSMTSSLPKNLFSGRSRKGSGGYVIADCAPQLSSSPKNGQAIGSSEVISRSQTLGNSPVHSYYFEGGMNHSDSNPVSSIHGSAYSSPSNTSLTAGSHASFFNSPTNTAGKSNTLSNVRALRDRYDSESSQHYSEQLVERQIDTLQMSQNEQTRSNPSISPGNLHNFSLSSSIGRDRSTDREYPHMGARSLERDHHYTGRSRSMERTDYTTQLYNQEMRNFRDSFILDLQSQVADLSKECAKLHQELDSTKDKLSSSMNSIKTFWSPELKKERALRKEESAKYCLLHEQLKVSQAELKKQSSIIQSLENQVSLDEDVQASTQISQQEIEILHREKDKQSKEILILRKTIDEMELRIDSQKQTLAARDESMKKLLEMLQNKGHSIQEIEDHRHEIENLQTQRLEDERKIKHLQNELSHQQSEMGLLKEGRNRLSDELKQVNLQLKQQPASIHTMKAMMEAKDSRISALEKDIQILEDRLIKSQESGSESSSKKEPAGKDSVTNIEKVLRAEQQDAKTVLKIYGRHSELTKAENLKKEVSTKETELEGLNLKVETMTSQQSENQQYISVLKEQVTAKDKQMSMLQSEIDEIREKLKEKNSTIDRKDQKSHTLQTEKRKIETEITELKDQIDAKDRKLTLLQRKVDALEEDVKEKDASITQLKASQTHMENATSAVTALEETITEKDKQIERLKEQRDRAESEHQEECDLYIKKNQDIKIEMDKLQLELTDKQTELCELREKVTEAASEKFELEKEMQERLEEINSVKTEFEKIKNEKEESENAKDLKKKIEELDFQVQKGQEETTTALKMVEQLQETVKKMEEEKTVKNQELEDMQEIIKEYKQKMGTLKRSKEIEKKKNAHLLEEARKREGDLSEDASQLKDAVIAKGDRIEELEEALKESVRITAEREMVMIEQQQQLEEAEAKVAELTMELARNKTTENSAKVNFLTKQLEEKELKLKRLQSERHKHLEEVYEMKQEAIQAAMSEKDANIALLEMTSTKQRRNTDEIEKLNKEKEKLQQQLKEVTQNRMKLIQKQERRSESLGRSKKSPSHKSKGCSPDRVNPYVLTAPASLDS